MIRDLIIPAVITAMGFFKPSGAALPVNIAKTDDDLNTSGLTIYTFTSKSLGVAAADRDIVVAVGTVGSGARVLSGVTVAGIAAVQEAYLKNPSGNSFIASVWRAAVPSGTTGNIVLTHDGTMLRCAITVYRMTGRVGAAADSKTSSANDPSVGLNIPANGAAVACGVTGAGTTSAWSGLTEDTDRAVGSNTVTSANKVFATQQVLLAVQINFGTNTNPALAAASWGP